MEQLESSALMRLVGVYGRLRARLKHELSAAPIVLPNGQYFPDHFDGSPAATQRLVQRMQQHGGMGDVPVRVVHGQAAATAAKQCGSGGCGPVAALSQSEPRLMLQDEGWLLRIEPAESAHPVGLTTLVAQALGLVLLEETRRDGHSLPEPVALHQELAGVMMGFGLLLLEGSHIYSKSCGGPQVTRLTALSTPELALLTALFAAERKLSLKPALRAASNTQRAHLDEAEALLRGNSGLLDWTRDATELDADPGLVLAPPKRALFGGLFNRGRSEPAPRLDDLEGALERELSAGMRSLPSGRKSSPVDEELKALVAEALRSEA
jgi:hypothetical protein